MKYEVLNLLKKNTETFLSGQLISEKLGVSRTSIWKYIKSLKEEGYKIDSSSKKGYRLTGLPDILTYEELKEYVNTKYIGKNIIHFESIDSTNDRAKKLSEQGAEHGTVVISEEQAGGKGRLGRIWCSPKYKGISMTIILRPNIDPMEASQITQIAAASMINSLKEFNIDAKVKWPNDIIINGKKVCGILTEMSGELNKVNYVIVGIGINANMDKYDFSKDLLDKATSIKIETKSNINRKALVGALLNEFEILYTEFQEKGKINLSVEICKNNSAVIGKNIKIIKNTQESCAKAVDLDGKGRLIVKHKDGSLEKLISGEISIRGLDSYI
ncbi:biotin--[acetyl-CoA-carboxylase] ligase [Clostridium luticellarii]|jgi:BirA family biotin operon repressor/biotin-[acetyl-CoA-carboxylase] ligase|uniref:Bifunctional ligase/repressor BirA n=1 Tax=Clostridium luticellarii TaxID=1691940 RepID=A0A2T0BN93_9CLOT|nr:biotin--[acetyl-CoA-carboxylase] ligase [Clostridium luticellarii]MCI1945657.1 biotin--[acetyl-CoA-carboxylase] ligase [Clostridium luticellarii]MCI1967413.1 biotin--[acetyl-CoA-carboxylase] ligase [Clostridium luticellarii]MCI1996291.1 biotin--[acetyl-CoA-carboxylase] ligase [Clostridium luticellarii]MCI2039804.1 biotin--[acetyl-CoA-carboxylase] ligase [Clostridium luticellarii]PRR85323.1 Bifunctional ligase/repressor BirA [Clostridium luticellarii]